ncbi:hypothetical protein SLA2020_184150 [Shorea laevis]
MNPPISSGDTANSINGGDQKQHQSPPRVYGCVIGVQRGRTVEIFNSFELLYDPSTHSLDRSFLLKKQELCMFLTVFQKLQQTTAEKKTQKLTICNPDKHQQNQNLKCHPMN